MQSRSRNSLLIRPFHVKFTEMKTNVYAAQLDEQRPAKP